MDATDERTIRVMVAQALGNCDQEGLDALILELVLGRRATADELDPILKDELAKAHHTIQDYWGQPCEMPGCVDHTVHAEPIGLLRFALADGREETYGWTGPWPPPVKLLRVSGHIMPEERMVAIAAPEDVDMAEMERAEMVVSTYRREVVATLEDTPGFYAASVYVLDGPQR